MSKLNDKMLQVKNVAIQEAASIAGEKLAHLVKKYQRTFPQDRDFSSFTRWCQKELNILKEYHVPLINDCARCRKVHKDMVAKPFTKPTLIFTIKREAITHFAICPNTNEPILMRILKTPKTIQI